MPGDLLRPFPWRESAHLALGLFTGLMLLVSIVVAVVLSPLVVFAPAVPLAAVAAFVGVGRLEAARFEPVLGEAVSWVSPSSPPSDSSSRWRALAADPAVLRLAGYALARAPLALIEVALFTVVFTWPLIMLASAVRALVIGQYLVAGPFVGGGWLMVAVGIVVAVVLVAVMTVIGPMLIRRVAWLDLVITRALLAPPSAELQERVGELVTARTRVMSAAEAERARIERDLHDGAQQRLIALGISLGRAEARLRRENPDGDALGLVTQAKAETMGVVADIRQLTSGLRPPILESRGLDAALSAVASRLRVPVEIRVDIGRPEPTIEAVLYFAMSECLTNVAKHAPGARATVRVSRGRQVITAVVSDDGPGGADLGGGSGLAGIADRLAGVDGRLWVSSPPGGPTVVRLEVPCES